MRHYVAVLLALVMMLALAGCHTDVEKMDISETVVETTVTDDTKAAADTSDKGDAASTAQTTTKSKAKANSSSAKTTKASAKAATTRATTKKSTTKATTAKGVTGTKAKSSTTTVTEDLYEGVTTGSTTQQSSMGTGVAN